MSLKFYLPASHRRLYAANNVAPDTRKACPDGLTPQKEKVASVSQSSQVTENNGGIDQRTGPAPNPHVVSTGEASFPKQVKSTDQVLEVDQIPKPDKKKGTQKPLQATEKEEGLGFP